MDDAKSAEGADSEQDALEHARRIGLPLDIARAFLAAEQRIASGGGAVAAPAALSPESIDWLSEVLTTPPPTAPSTRNRRRRSKF